MTRPRPSIRMECACGCGEVFSTTRADQKHVNASHRQRAYRAAVKRANAAVGLPAVLSLKTARAARGTRTRLGDAYGGAPVDDSASRATTPVRRDTESGRVRVSLTLDEARTLLDERARGIRTSAASRRLLDKIAAGLARKT